MRTRWTLGVGVLALIVLGLIVVACVGRARSSLYYKYHQIYIGMPKEELHDLLRMRASRISGGIGGMITTYESDEGVVVIHAPFMGEDAGRVSAKSFTPKDSAPIPLRWFLENHSVEEKITHQSKFRVHGGIQ